MDIVTYALLKKYIDEHGGGASSWDDLTGKPFDSIGDGLNVDADGVLAVVKPTAESYTIPASAWAALSDKSPFDFAATVTPTYQIGTNTTVELVNDNAVLFAVHGFSIGAVENGTVTIYSIGAPEDAVTLEVEYNG